MANSGDAAVVAALNDLIETCQDGIEGFRTSAEHAKNPQVKTMLLSRMESVRQAMTDLQTAVRRLGGDTVQHGHVAAPLHRGWINLKAAVTGNSDEAILDEVVRGEEFAVKHYRDVLAKPLPPDVHTLVKEQARGAETNLERVRAYTRSGGPAVNVPDTRPEARP
jgi:uncharacterized protein (TIGR02284 family)